MIAQSGVLSSAETDTDTTSDTNLNTDANMKTGTGTEGGAPPTLMVALPKGRMADDALGLMAAAGLPLPQADAGRKLVVPSDDGRYQYIMAKPSDVPTYVEYGAADIGICGLDTLRESGRAVYEPLLLPFAHCRLSVCAPADRPDTPLRYETQPRVATKYPKLTMEFFRNRGVNAEVIALNGSVELGPLVGLADLIVDLVETGSTLRANGLVEIRRVMDSQAVLIVNRAAYRLKADAVRHAINALRAQIAQSAQIAHQTGTESTNA
jgi:ATP phosphoribosyltransferase